MTMHRRMTRLSLLAVLGIATAGAAPAAKLELKPCTTIPGLPAEARCGTYEVWENRAAQSGRKIPLRVVVIPAKGPDRLPDPFIYFEGGPGQSSVAAAPLLLQEIGALHQRRTSCSSTSGGRVDRPACSVPSCRAEGPRVSSTTSAA